MKRNISSQLLVIEADNGQVFQDAFNEAMITIDNEKVDDIIFPKGRLHCAYILYRRSINVVETLKDTYELGGCKFTCSNCKLFIRPTDLRKKRGTCSLYDKEVRTTQEACNVFYEAINTGQVKPIDDTTLLEDLKQDKKRKQQREIQARYKAKENRRLVEEEKRNIEYKKQWLKEHGKED